MEDFLGGHRKQFHLDLLKCCQTNQSVCNISKKNESKPQEISETGLTVYLLWANAKVTSLSNVLLENSMHYMHWVTAKIKRNSRFRDCIRFM